MMKLLLSLICLLGIGGCQTDEGAYSYGAQGEIWQLQSLNGAPFISSATLSFPEEGRIAGQGPCNRYFAEQTAPYPWFEIGEIGATKMACFDEGGEGIYFETLGRMSLIEIQGETLILSNSEGENLVYSAQN